MLTNQQLLIINKERATAKKNFTLNMKLFYFKNLCETNVLWNTIKHYNCSSRKANYKVTERKHPVAASFTFVAYSVPIVWALQIGRDLLHALLLVAEQYSVSVLHHSFCFVTSSYDGGSPDDDWALVKDCGGIICCPGAYGYATGALGAG